MSDVPSPGKLSDDLIWGAAAIADEIGISRRKVYYLLEGGKLPARKIGDLWVGSRRTIRAALVGDAA
jgi:hypothetical protein